MDPNLLRVFQKQVWLQCGFATDAYAQLGDAMQRVVAASSEVLSDHPALVDLPPEEYRVRSIMAAMQPSVRPWSAIQLFLTATANVSKAFWGQGGSLTVERLPLRQSLQVEDDSPIRETAMRNHFDHFDDRLDTWWRDSKRHKVIDLNYGPIDSPWIVGIDKTDMFRNFDHMTGDLIFWGERYSLPPIADELARIGDLAGLQGFDE